MDRVEELEAAIEALPREDYRRLVDRLLSIEQKRWDEQMDRDNATGKLDWLFDEAEADVSLLSDWPPRQ